MTTKAELVEQLGKGRTKAEVAELEGMSKADLEDMANGPSPDTTSPSQGETVEGGRFKVGGRIVNADGEPIK